MTRRWLVLIVAVAGIARAQVGQLSCGSPLTGTLSAGVPQAAKFHAEAGDSVLLRILSSAQPSMEVRDSSNNLVSFRQNPVDTTLAGAGILVYDLASAGDYQVNLKSGSAGPYQLVMMPLNRPCSNPTLACGAPVKGGLTIAGQMQSYQFNGKQGDQVSLRIVKTGGDPQSSFLVLGYDSKAQVQLVPSKSGPAALVYSNVPALRADYKLTSDGAQTILIAETNGKAPANFAIAMVRLNGGCPGAKTIGCGTALDDAIGDILAANTYTVNAGAGDIYLLRLRRTETNTASGFQPGAEVYDPQGNAVPLTSAAAAAAQFTTTAAGAYTVLLADTAGTQSGSYALSLARLNNPCNAQPLGCGSVADGRISGVLRLATYSVNANANDVYLLRLMRTDFTGQFRALVDIYGPDGSRVQTVTSDSGSVTFNAPAAGAYSLIATDGFDGTQSGGFSVSLARLNRPCDGTPALSCGTAVSGGIDRPLKMGLYGYTAGAGDSFTVRLVDTAGNLQSGLQVYDPQGRAVQAVSGGKAVDVVQGAAGAYTVLVTDTSQATHQGTFLVQLLSTKGGCAASPPPGQSTRGLVSGTAPFSAYALRSAAGDRLLLRLASYTPGFTANMDVYDPDGRRLSSGTFAIAPPPSAGGTYTAVVGGSSPKVAGSYAFSWQSLNNPAPDTPPLQCGQTLSSTLGADAQFRFYTLSANNGDLLKLLLARLPDTLNAQVELFDPSGTRLGASNTEINRAATGGNYLVLVSPATASAETGAFTLAFQRPNNPCAPAALVCGQSVLRQVTAPGQLDAYTFSGSAGDQITLRAVARAGGFVPFVELYDPSGALNPASGAVSTIAGTLAAAGQYAVLVHDRADVNTGSYRLGLQRGNNACPEDDSQPPSIRLLRPTGGEVIAGGSIYRISWASDDNVDVTAHSVRLSMDGGNTFAPLNTGLSGTVQSFDWLVPADIAPTRQAVIQVTATDRAGNSQSAASGPLSLIGSGFTPNTSVSYVYDGLNRVVQATYGDGRVVNYTYDSAGNLVAITAQ